MTFFLIILLCILFLLLLGIPIGYVFGIGALVYVYGSGQDISYMLPAAFNQIGSFAILALPLFILVGQLMVACGVSERLLDFIEALVGKVKGGLGAVTVMACMIIGAISGSAAAAIAAVGGILIERMIKTGYTRGYAVALVACSSVLAQLIPPSIPMIIFALLSGISVSAAFLSTVIPGLLIGTIYCIINFTLAKKWKYIKDVKSSQTQLIVQQGRWKNLLIATKRALLALVMPVIMLGGIYSGKFTPTEAAAIAAAYVTIIALTIYRKNTSYGRIKKELIIAAEMTGSIIFVLFSIAILSRAMLLEQIPTQITEMLIGISDVKWVVLLALNAILILIGMIVDDVSGSIVAAIVLYPVASKLGLDPLHFAAIVGVNLGLGNVTPPTAPLLYMAGGIGKANLSEYIKPAFMFMLIGHLPVLLMVTYIPDLALALPKYLMGQ